MKLFISYHLANQKAVRKIKNKLVDKQIDFYSVPEDADFSGWSHQKINDYILQSMKDCQVLLCVVGKETYSRPHVDHELHHSLKGGVGKRLGWIVCFLEERIDNVNDIDYSTFPARISDNEDYACMVQNASLISKIEELINDASSKRNSNDYQIDNTRKCMEFSGSKYY